MPQDPILTIARPDGPWSLVSPTQKLLTRGALPGAFGYDLAADGFGALLANGADPLALLPAAMPTSWMVNNKATSRVFQRWLIPPLCDHWQALTATLCDLSPAEWLDVSAPDRALVQAHVRALCVDGQGVAAVSKVLTLLCPKLLFLMDDAALWFLCGAPARPSTAETPTAGADHFVSALDAFCRAVLANAEALSEVAAGYPLSGLCPSQILDRLVWFESWGWLLFRESKPLAWCWLRDAQRQAILGLAPAPPKPSADALDLEALPPNAWTQKAQEALQAAFPSIPESLPDA